VAYYPTSTRLGGSLLGLSVLCLGSAITIAVLTTQYAYRVAQLAVSRGLLSDAAFVSLFVQGPLSITILALVVAGLEIVGGLLLLSFRGMYIRRELASARKMFIIISTLLLISLAISFILLARLFKAFSITGFYSFCYVGLASTCLAAASAVASIVLMRLCIVEIEKFAGLRRPRRQISR